MLFSLNKLRLLQTQCPITPEYHSADFLQTRTILYITSPIIKIRKLTFILDLIHRAI